MGPPTDDPVTPRFPFRTGWIALVLAWAVSVADGRAQSLPAAPLDRVERPARGETSRALATAAHDVGAFKVSITNLGALGVAVLPDTGRAIWRGASYLSLAGLWIGGVIDGQPRVSTGGYQFEFLPSGDPADVIYLSTAGTPGGNPLGGAADPDDDHDGVADEDFHNGRDDDQDGRIDEDFAAISDQMYSCEFRDDDPEARAAYPEHLPLPVRVRQRTFAWAALGDDEFIGIEVTVENLGATLLSGLQLGYFLDADIGPPEIPFHGADDGGRHVVVDTSFADPLRMGYATEPIRFILPFMYDVPDEGGDRFGDADGFVGLLVLGHTIDLDGESAPAAVGLRACRFTNQESASPYPIGSPRNDTERYDLLSLPEFSSGPGGLPGDLAMSGSVGPFEGLAPGESVVLECALVVGEGYVDAEGADPRRGVDGRPNEHTLLSNALRLWMRFHNTWNRYGEDLQPPVPVVPADQATEQPNALTLRWRSEPTATAYHLSVARDEAFLDTLAVGGVIHAASSFVLGPLDGPARYFWRIRSLSGADSSAWSPARSFTTQDPFLHVWPGDCNLDGVVDARDILPLGRHFGSSGVARASSSLEWRDQPISRDAWSPAEACAADCDGSGRVDSADVTGIIQNWYRLRSGGWLREVDPASSCVEILNAIGASPTPELASMRGAVLAYLRDRLRVYLSFQAEHPCPNPCREGATISYVLPRRADVVWFLHDTAGRLVRRIAERDAPLGPGAIRWDGRTESGAEAPAGVYFYRLQAGLDQASGRLVVVEGR